ncbi:GGDEF domain-containing protein [Rhodococcus sp. BP-349]|uniref:GGDEF domain-containing protein n=1 Tax=unclassified Rhodococcus (in: high G+C Gram-positive bacteria) TaxID=192944 RepID=UPI001C9B71ED|nr:MULTISPECIES: GGDEF domain-containing protein [unclassified Rhodococcus (in: high G+C Gram-positive bacteria)]MBY6537516.1 GGDEF domain-containing protein [Rhodococcus sp. BP-363]MBY6541853.1 GGDEF domain-containing protein [Rhodococcus sp. BP-369]MBY6561083.1 GGDEF domain-containing protein [Rhodococcus sp. BP-370]MBY6575375.1 GGDEF domain-containing protein [Rhodococcus sp. BP-364]MBY6584676.1 GGDEF domain-containing protein [Rhodococcus sp. BP-358]
MFHVVGEWWSRPFDYSAMPGYMAQRGLQRPYRRMMAAVVLMVVLAGSLLLFTSGAPTSPLARAVFGTCLAAGAVSALPWIRGTWPSRRGSLLFLFGDDVALVVGLAMLADVQASFTVSVVFALLGIYCGYFHSIRTLIAHIALTVAVSLYFFVSAATDGDSDVAYLSVLLVVQLALFLLAPLLSQIPLSYLRDDAYRSGTDPLTGALNRRGLGGVVHAPLLATVGDHEVVAVMVIDLDRFKSVNDRVGHDGGDEVLRRVSERLQNRSSAWAYVARLGGEEFCVVGIVPRSELRDRLDHVHASVRCDADPVPVTASAGVAWIPGGRWTRDADEVQLLIRRADRLMYEAKRAGGDRLRFDDQAYTTTDNART